MSRLKSKHLQTNGGVNWIIIDRTKTEKTLEIPLLKKAENLISKYTFDKVLELPVVSNQRFNSYLKEIAEIVGIEKNLTHHVARKTFATTVLLENNIPIEIVSHVLGHTSIKVTQDHYGKILSSSVAKEFKSLNSKL
jgi:site-specific recombinase XerD